MRTKALFLVLTVVFLLACGGVSTEQLTATAVAIHSQTAAAAPTLTPTPAPTFTPTSAPEPTETPQPTDTPVPSPVAVGETVEHKNLEITLLEVVTHTQIMLSGGFGYDANDGYIFIDMTVLIRNRGDSPVNIIKMGEIYVVDKNAHAWPPFYGGYRVVELEKRFNPMASIKLDPISVDDVIPVQKDTYLRLVFPVLEHQKLIFGVQDSPPFIITVE